MTNWLQQWQTQALGTAIAKWIRAWLATCPPDPWPPELDEAVRDPAALAVCHHCFAPQEDSGWFCRECGAATGPYNNTMPYLHIFSTGEVLRSGVGPAARFTKLTVFGYVVLGFIETLVLAPMPFGNSRAFADDFELEWTRGRDVLTESGPIADRLAQRSGA